MFTHYCHGGKLGDCIFSIPAFRASGCSRYLLADVVGQFYGRWDPAAVVPLLEAQGIACDVLRGGGIRRAAASWLNGDTGLSVRPVKDFRGRGRWTNHVERHLIAIGSPPEAGDGPWLQVTPRRVVRAVFCRSARYRPAWGRVDWTKAGVDYAGEAGFLGTEREYCEFVAEWGGDIQYLPCRDLLAAAEICAGAEVGFGNQTAIQAIMAGVGLPHALEECEAIACCRFDGIGQRYEYGDSLFIGGREETRAAGREAAGR